VTTLNNATLDHFADIAERHDTIAPLESYLHTAAVSGWDIGVRLGLIEDVVAADMDGDTEGALAMLDEIASAGDCGNWQVAAYRAWRMMEPTGKPNADRVDGVWATDSHLLTLARRIAMLTTADYRDIDYSRWRDGWGAMQSIASAVLAAHAAGDDAACEDLLDILSSAVDAGAVEPPRIRRRREFGTLGFAGGLGAVVGEVADG
jgi:hypothetical protein